MPHGSGPLAGLLIADFSRVLAGPFATMMLADLGARVVKVERPDGGDDSRAYGPFLDGRSLYFARVNRGKESVALDLKQPADLAVARRLATRADVLVENYRPGVMDRLGLGWSHLQPLAPGLVYCSISGFGHTGPWRERPAYDAVVLDIAMYDATVSLLEGAALSWLATGRDPGRIGNAHFAIAPFDTFSCRDRDITICAANDVLFGVLVTALGAPRLATDARFASNAERHASRGELKAELEAVLRTDIAQHWLAVLAEVGVPSGPISDVAEAVGSEQARVRNMVVQAGGLPVPGNPVKASAYDDPAVRPAAPELDEHGDAVRAEFS
ncbi:MAG: CoA transferase [Actinobacteria bacterium]|nr:CoA transferase [Actinomycetota bacterium]